MKKLNKLPIKRGFNKYFPNEPGVYIFWENSKPIYVGKALNLKNRISSYFLTTLLPKTKRMISQANYLSYIIVLSEIEALLLEAKLIKDWQPFYNFSLKDDKNPLYIKITKEKYPRVLTARKISDKKDVIDYFGPFPSSGSVRFVLKSLRKPFPYSEHNISKRECLYSQLGLCNPCPNQIEKEKDLFKKSALRKKYLKNIFFIRKVLSGKSNYVKKRLEKEMYSYALNENYEEATECKSALDHFNYITQPKVDSSEFLKNPNFAEDLHLVESEYLKKILKPYFPNLGNLSRIECYDVAHLSGLYSTASMVTFMNGEKTVQYYRQFKLKNSKPYDDYSSLEEVAKRRSKYFDKWGKPDLIIVDGGRGQVTSFLKIIAGFNIPAIGFAKQKDNLVIRYKDKYLSLYPKKEALNLLLRIRNEAHRFARRYHHLLIKKNLIP